MINHELDKAGRRQSKGEDVEDLAGENTLIENGNMHFVSRV